MLDCWCKENRKEKTAAIEAGEATEAELEASLKEVAAKMAEIKTKRDATQDEVDKDWAALNEAKAEREMDEIMKQHDQKFKSLNQRQKGSAKSVASRCHQQEEENMLMVFLYAWNTETREQLVVKNYGAKLDQKKQKLDAVQTMFRSFANQLEQGIGNWRGIPFGSYAHRLD